VLDETAKAAGPPKFEELVKDRNGKVAEKSRGMVLALGGRSEVSVMGRRRDCANIQYTICDDLDAECDVFPTFNKEHTFVIFVIVALHQALNLRLTLTFSSPPPVHPIYKPAPYPRYNYSNSPSPPLPTPSET
jgi:hypothetical protein